MKPRYLSASLLTVLMLACAPAGAQAAGCAPHRVTVTRTVTVTTTTTTTTPTTTTPPVGTTTTPTTTTPTTTTPTTTTPTTTTTTTTTTRKVRTHRTVAIAARSTRLTLDGLFTIGRAHVTVPGRAVTFAGRIHPYVSGQRVSVTEALNGRKFKTVSIVPACVAHGDVGVFKLTVSAPAPGGVSVSVRHKRGKTMKSFHVLGTFKALETALRPDQTGQFVELVQQRLAALHIFIRQTGVYDLGTQLALDAYHRLLGEGEGIYTLNSKTLTALLNGEGAFHVRYPGQGQHAEGDLSDQLLAFINGGQVHWIFPISSGKPSTPTILGQFQVYYKEPEYTSDGMYFSSFFHGGYAIHGYDPAPPFPASHGCMRLPMVDAITAFNWINVGDWVDTYYT